MAPANVWWRRCAGLVLTKREWAREFRSGPPEAVLVKPSPEAKIVARIMTVSLLMVVMAVLTVGGMLVRFWAKTILYLFWAYWILFRSGFIQKGVFVTLTVVLIIVYSFLPYVAEMINYVLPMVLMVLYTMIAVNSTIYYLPPQRRQWFWTWLL